MDDTYCDVLSGFHCPSDETYLTNVFGVLIKDTSKLVVVGKCHVCEKAGRQPSAHGIVQLEHGVALQALCEGMIYVVF